MCSSDLTLATATLPPGDAGIISATAALGRVLQERGSYAAAIPVLADVVHMRIPRHLICPEYRAEGLEGYRISRSLVRIQPALPTHWHFIHAGRLDSVIRL